MNKFVSVIVVAGGTGKRFGGKTPKSFVRLKGKPLLSHCLAVFEKSRFVDEIICVGHKDYIDLFKRTVKPFDKVAAIVQGGQRRSDSVRFGLAAVDCDADYVLVHDAARPFVDEAMIERVVKALDRQQAVIAAVPVKATIKKVAPKSLIVDETPRRDLLWEVQTPQGFHRKTLMRAHTHKATFEATDDAMLIERMGLKVKVVMGDYRNIKVTTPEDLVIAKSLC